MLQFHVSGPLDVGPVLGPGMLLNLNIYRYMSLRFSLPVCLKIPTGSIEVLYRRRDHTY